jgi:hypothetical protein
MTNHPYPSFGKGGERGARGKRIDGKTQDREMAD